MAITKFAIRHKRLVSVLLILCVVFFNIYAMQQEAKAFVLVDDLALLLAFAVTALVAWGVTFATQQAAQQAAENIVYDTTYDANADGYNDYIVDAATTGQAVYDVATGAYQWVSRIADEDLQWWRDYIHSHYTAGENYATFGGSETTSISNVAYEYVVTAIVTYTANGYNWECDMLSDGINLYKDGSLVYDTYNDVEQYGYKFQGSYFYVEGFISGSWNLMLMEFADTNPNITIDNTVTTDTGVYVDPDIYNDNTYTPTNSKTGEPDIPCDVYPAPGDTTGDITLADGTGLDVDLEQTISDVVGKNPDYVLDKDIVGVPELVQVPDLTLNPDEAVNDTQTAENAMTADETQTSLKGLFISKFPFCIPWDLANAFKLISAPAEAPHFEIDFLAPLDDTVHFQGSTEIDFDMADYPLIGQVCRWCFTIEFCIALMLATRKVMKW